METGYLALAIIGLVIVLVSLPTLLENAKKNSHYKNDQKELK